jgi:hypothetical protein
VRSILMPRRFLYTSARDWFALVVTLIFTALVWFLRLHYAQ